MAVGSRIFISYRRTDTSAYAGRLYDQLNATFPGQVFMDVDTLEPGIDFVQRIEESVDSADVLIAVIGRGWASAVDEEGRRRLDQPDDFVRLEVAEALDRAIRVIPVLVGGAAMPEADELPPDLAPLARRNGLTLTDLEWRAGVDRLTATIGQVLGVPISTRDKRRATSTQPLSSAFLPLALGGPALLAVALFMPWNQGQTLLAPSFGPAAHARHA